jgi:hypothetical protein
MAAFGDPSAFPFANPRPFADGDESHAYAPRATAIVTSNVDAFISDPVGCRQGRRQPSQLLHTWVVRLIAR